MEVKYKVAENVSLLQMNTGTKYWLFCSITNLYSIKKFPYSWQDRVYYGNSQF